MQTPGTPHGPQPRKPPRKQSREPARPADGQRDPSVRAGGPARPADGRRDPSVRAGGQPVLPTAGETSASGGPLGIWGHLAEKTRECLTGGAA